MDLSSINGGVLYVDDVNLLTMDDEVDDALQLWDEAQRSTITWAEVLNDSGGTLKGEKCYGHLIAYDWSYDGSWHYSSAPDYDLQIKLPDGAYESIALLDPAEARVNLGVAFSPAGDDTMHLRGEGSARDKWKSVKTRADVWLTRLRNSHLPSKYAWVSYRFQLWASIKYGLGVLSAPLKELEEITPNFAFNALPSLGVNRNIRSGWRYLHSSFGGVGLIDLATETAIARLNMFLQHWDNPAPIGISLRTSMEYLQLEIGCQGCPLDEPFEPMGAVCTDSWVKSFWECIRWFGLAPSKSIIQLSPCRGKMI